MILSEVIFTMTNCFTTSLWSVSLSSLPLAQRGLSSHRWAANLTSTQKPSPRVPTWEFEGTNSPSGLWLESPSQALLFPLFLKLLLHLLKGLHESPEQVSGFLQRLLNSSLCFAQPENMNHVTAAWLPPMWLPSSPPRAALCYFLLCLRSLKKPHKHQYGSNFSARSPSVGSLHSLIV